MTSAKRRGKNRGAHLDDYVPLVVVLAVAILAACALQIGRPPSFQVESTMLDFMGIFLVIFSLLKLFDLEGFADGFQMYDLLARHFRPYAYLYPFLELGFGLGFLARWEVSYLYGGIIVLTLFGAAGVFWALKKGLDLQCACMGTTLHVPLTTVALVEDLGMAAMALAMLLIGTAAGGLM